MTTPTSTPLITQSNSILLDGKGPSAPARDRTFPYGGKVQDRLTFLLRYARSPETSATSIGITCITEDDYVFVQATAIENLRRDELIVAGLEIDHLVRAMKVHLMDPHVEAFPDPSRPNLVARVSCIGDYRPALQDLRIFSSIETPAAYRHPETHVITTDEELQVLSQAASDFGVRLRWVKESQPVESYPGPCHLMVLYTADNDPKSWLEAGRALSSVLLITRDLGVLAFVVPPVDTDVLTKKFSICAGPCHHAQAILRVGTTMPWQPKLDDGAIAL